MAWTSPRAAMSVPLHRLAVAGGVLRREKELTGALAALVTLLALGVLGPVFWPVDPLAIDIGATLQPPSWAHPMGTDGVGRDVFARFNQGALISFSIGAAVVAAGAVVGGAIGLAGGTARGALDNLLMRCMDAILAFPPIIMVMAVTIVLGSGLATAAVGIIVTSIPWYARLTRSDVVRIRALPFIEAARAIGTSPRRIVYHHILPHTLATLGIQAAALFGYAVLTLAALGFIGLGAQIPTPEWGVMITDGLGYAMTGQWWVGVFPGIGLLIAVTAATVLADRLRDILDPRGHYTQI